MSEQQEIIDLLVAMGSDPSKIKVEHDDFGEKILAQCPMHYDSNPSFMIRPGSQVFNCFSCGSGPEVPLAGRSGVISLYRKHIKHTTGKTISVKDAIKFVSKYVSLPNTKGKKKLKKKLHREVEIPVLPESYLSAFFPSKKHYRYMKDRGFTKKTLDDNQIGYDAIRKRVVFPIRNGMGELVSFTGRLTLSKERIDAINAERLKAGKKPVPRYYIYYNANKRFLLMNEEYVSDYSEDLIVVESPMDYLALRQCGYDNVCAIFGSHVSEYQFEKMKHFSRIILALDNDAAGVSGTEKFIKMTQGKTKVFVPDYDENDTDFDQMPADRVRHLIENAPQVAGPQRKRIPTIDY